MSLDCWAYSVATERSRGRHAKGSSKMVVRCEEEKPERWRLWKTPQSTVCRRISAWRVRSTRAEWCWRSAEELYRSCEDDGEDHTKRRCGGKWRRDPTKASDGSKAQRQSKTKLEKTTRYGVVEERGGWRMTDRSEVASARCGGAIPEMMELWRVGGDKFNKWRVQKPKPLARHLDRCAVDKLCQHVDMLI